MSWRNGCWKTYLDFWQRDRRRRFSNSKTKTSTKKFYPIFTHLQTMRHNLIFPFCLYNYSLLRIFFQAIILCTTSNSCHKPCAMCHLPPHASFNCNQRCQHKICNNRGGGSSICLWMIYYQTRDEEEGCKYNKREDNGSSTFLRTTYCGNWKEENGATIIK